MSEVTRIARRPRRYATADPRSGRWRARCGCRACRGAAHRRGPELSPPSMPASWRCRRLSPACRGPSQRSALRARAFAALRRTASNRPSRRGRRGSARSTGAPWRPRSWSRAVLASGTTYWATMPHAPDDSRKLSPAAIAAACSPQPGRCRLVRPPHGQALARRAGRPVAAAIDLAKDGFALIGGRVEVIGDRPVPALVYRHHEHLITLVAEPQAGDTAPVRSRSIFRPADSRWSTGPTAPSRIGRFRTPNGPSSMISLSVSVRRCGRRSSLCLTIDGNL